jgi:hypothetical protein
VLSFGFCLLYQFLGLAGGTSEASVLTQITSLPGSDPRKARLIKQYSKPTIDYDDAPTVAEVSLPWRRGVNGGTLNSLFHSHKVVHSFYLCEIPQFYFFISGKIQSEKLTVLSLAYGGIKRICHMHYKKTVLEITCLESECVV